MSHHLKTMIIAVAATVLSVGSAWAQSTSYYAPNGQYIGSSRTQTYPFGGGTTSYFGANGQYMGSSHRTR